MPDINSKIEFTYANQSSFDSTNSAGNIKPNSVYFVEDTRRIYVGSTLIANSINCYILNYGGSEATIKSTFESMLSDPSEYIVYMKVGADTDYSLVVSNINAKVVSGAITEIIASVVSNNVEYKLTYNVSNKSLSSSSQSVGFEDKGKITISDVQYNVSSIPLVITFEDDTTATYNVLIRS